MSILLAGNYDESLSDAKTARQFQPTYMKAIERGKAWYLLKTIAHFLSYFFQKNNS